MADEIVLTVEEEDEIQLSVTEYVSAAANVRAKTLEANGTYLSSDEGYDGYTPVTVAVPLGAKSIAANGTYAASADQLAGYSSVEVAVPNTYSVSDEGKVVSGGTLVKQTTLSVTENGTYDTTTRNSVTVSVAGGEGRGYGYYGFMRAKNLSSPSERIAYVGDAFGMTPAKMVYSNGLGTFDWGDWREFVEAIARPVMLRSDGTVDYELNHNDQRYKLDGETPSDWDNASYDGNAMVEFGNAYKWVKRYEDSAYEYVLFAKERLDEGYHAYAHTNDAGEVKDAFYLSMFTGPFDGEGKLRSLGGGLSNCQNMEEQIARAKANGGGWNIAYKSAWDYVNDLLTLIGKTDDSQTAFGNGYGITGSTAPRYENMPSSGAFWGKNTYNAIVKALWLENWWGNAWQYLNGLVSESMRVKARMFGPYMERPVSAWDSGGYVDTGIVLPSGGMGEQICGTSTVDAYGFLPISARGTSYNSYVPDICYAQNSSQTPTVRVFAVGAGYGDANARKGARATAYSAVADNASTGYVARLSYIPQ